MQAWLRGSITIALVFAAFIPIQAHPPSFTPDQQQIIETVKAIFVAAKAADMAKFESVVAPGFYLYDGGHRFDGEAIMDLMKTLHAQGKRLEWRVTEPDVHVYGNVGWIAYVNQGAVGDASGMTEQKWLESAFLEKQGSRWKIVFMHSTRVAPAVK
ncbi:MAG TPA: nuclear transport factor 2 family protein [Candidatus Binatia bacterium]|nr:nuclear transport factor 2 family protein [Candidatus Binatia bacterium]